MCAGDGSVGTLIERVNLNSGVGSGGECTLSMLKRSAEMAQGMRIGRQVLLVLAIE